MSGDRARNLLFVMTDHQRGDSIGMTQAGVEVTPNLNSVAAEGTVFSRAYTTCPLCAPARTALVTGKYPTRNGVVVNDWRGVSAQDHRPLHQILYEAGYAVGHIGVHHVRVDPPLEERVPFTRWAGDAEYAAYCRERDIRPEGEEDLRPFRRRVTENQGGRRAEPLYSSTQTAVWPHDARHFKDLYWCREAADSIRREHDGPFALFVYLWAPHPPLRVPEPYASLFDPAQLDLPANVDEPAEGEPPNRRLGIAAQLAEGLPMDQWRAVWAAHLGLVHLADTGIGGILEALDASGKAEDTLTVFTADHGDHLGQHRMYQKMEMYEPALRVPLIVRGPGVQEQAISTPVSHLDLMPTVLAFLGLQVPDDLDGRSLLTSLTEGAPVPERPVFAQYSGNPTRGDVRRCVVTGQYKYIFDPADEAELYDLAADPLEMRNLAGDPLYASVLRDLREQCEVWGRAHGDWVFT